jgi:hypothetical protein
MTSIIFAMFAGGLATGFHGLVWRGRPCPAQGQRCVRLQGDGGIDGLGLETTSLRSTFSTATASGISGSRTEPREAHGHLFCHPAQVATWTGSRAKPVTGSAVSWAKAPAGKSDAEKSASMASKARIVPAFTHEPGVAAQLAGSPHGRSARVFAPGPGVRQARRTNCRISFSGATRLPRRPAGSFWPGSS